MFTLIFRCIYNSTNQKTNMKKSVFTVFFALLGAGAFAQTSQGTMAVSGSVNFRNETIRNHSSIPTEHKVTNRAINLQPSIGYFVKDKLEVGLGIGLNRYSYKLEQEDDDTSGRNLNVSLNPYIRKYVALTDQLLLHGTGYATVGFGNSKIRNTADNTEEITQTSDNFGFGIYPGLTYFATPKIGFTASFGSLSFSRTKEKPNDSAQAERTTYRYDANLHPSSISIGFGYFIAR